MLSKQIPLGIYEKALPAGECWLERLQLAKTLGFDFVEMSVDETDDRLSRLDWSREQRLALVNAIVETGVRVQSPRNTSLGVYSVGSSLNKYKSSEEISRTFLYNYK